MGSDNPRTDTPADYLTQDMDKTYYSDDPTVRSPRRKSSGPKREVSVQALANLIAHRKGTQFGGPNIRRCKTCKRLAVRGLDVCYFHGGRKTVEERKRARGEPVGSRGKMARKKVYQAIKKGDVPIELAREPAFQATWSEATPRLLGSGPFDPARLSRRTAASILAWELVVAWRTLLKDGDYGPWLDAIQKAKTLNFI